MTKQRSMHTKHIMFRHVHLVHKHVPLTDHSVHASCTTDVNYNNRPLSQQQKSNILYICDNLTTLTKSRAATNIHHSPVSLVTSIHSRCYVYTLLMDKGSNISDLSSRELNRGYDWELHHMSIAWQNFLS
jgi:hypothetical protein